MRPYLLTEHSRTAKDQTRTRFRYALESHHALDRQPDSFLFVVLKILSKVRTYSEKIFPRRAFSFIHVPAFATSSRIPATSPPISVRRYFAKRLQRNLVIAITSCFQVRPRRQYNRGRDANERKACLCAAEFRL